MGRSMRNRPDPACVFSKQSATKTDRALIFAVDIRWKQLMDSGTLLEEEEEDEEESTTWRYLYKSFSLPSSAGRRPLRPTWPYYGKRGRRREMWSGKPVSLISPSPETHTFPPSAGESGVKCCREVEQISSFWRLINIFLCIVRVFPGPFENGAFPFYLALSSPERNGSLGKS